MAAAAAALSSATIATVVVRGSASPAPVRAARPRSVPIPSHSSMSPDAQRAVVGEYCLTCHDDDHEKGGLSLETFDPARAELNAEIAEKMVHKLRAGMMPPTGADRPDAATLNAFVSALEARLDQAAAARPNPGRRTFQRLNRAEYAASIRDLLGLEIDVTAFLPPDTVSHNFDNIADVQSLSPTLLEGYLRAASRISRSAVGDPDASPSSTIYKVPRTASQLTHLEGAPFGTRGGISAVSYTHLTLPTNREV